MWLREQMLAVAESGRGVLALARVVSHCCAPNDIHRSPLPVLHAMTHSSMPARSPTRERHPGDWDRLLDVVIDPVHAFQGIDAHPVWGVAFVALVGLRFGSVLAFYRPDITAAKLVTGILFQVVTLLPLPPGQTFAEVLAVNAAGVIVGNTEDGETPFRTVTIWNPQ